MDYMYICISLVQYYRKAIATAIYCGKTIFHYLSTSERSEKRVKNIRSYHLNTGTEQFLTGRHYPKTTR